LKALRRAIAILLIVAAALPMVGCGAKEEGYNPSNIAVKQPGTGPPPMNVPMGSTQDKAKTKS